MGTLIFVLTSLVFIVGVIQICLGEIGRGLKAIAGSCFFDLGLYGIFSARVLFLDKTSGYYWLASLLSLLLMWIGTRLVAAASRLAPEPVQSEPGDAQAGSRVA